MAKFYGMIGFSEEVELRPGVYDEAIVERPYYGDIKQALRRYNEREEVVGEVTIGNRIEILADGYALDHIFTMRYVEWQGVRWTVGTAEVKHPRLVLSLREVYNGPTPEAPGDPGDPDGEP